MFPNGEGSWAFKTYDILATGETNTLVPGNQAFTDAGIAVSAGEQVSIVASGKIHYCGSTKCTSAPAGSKFASHNCGSDQYGENFTEPGLNCWGLVFKVGSAGVPFPVGAKLTFTAPVTGELYFGANDGNYSDNSGAWEVKVNT